MSDNPISNYRTYPFTEETPQDGFYKFMSISDCFVNCCEDSDDIKKCRTIGLIYSDCGKFHLKDLLEDAHIRISLRYLKTPPQSTVIPYPVQVFGHLQWRNRPVIFVKIMKMLSIPNALHLTSILASITEKHLATSSPWSQEDT